MCKRMAEQAVGIGTVEKILQWSYKECEDMESLDCPRPEGKQHLYYY